MPLGVGMKIQFQRRISGVAQTGFAIVKGSVHIHYLISVFVGLGPDGIV